MNEKEMLEFAAKAYGIKLVTWSKPTKFAIKDSSPLQMWNPLTDDGDALRLAVKLEMRIDISNISSATYTSKTDAFLQFSDEMSDDSYAATRRAIVRAAAEIGKNL